VKRSLIKLSRTLWVVCFASILAGVGFGAPPPLATDGPKPFFTGCVEKQGVDSDLTGQPWVERPAKNQITSVFYDVPFSAHVPLEVRHEAGIVRVTYGATVISLHLEQSEGTRNIVLLYLNICGLRKAA
jgi:hypothetical protein